MLIVKKHVLIIVSVILMALFIILANCIVAIANQSYLEKLAAKTTTYDGLDRANVTSDVISYVVGNANVLSSASSFREEELVHLADIRSKLAKLRFAFFVAAFGALSSLLLLYLRAKSISKFFWNLRKLFFCTGIGALPLFGVAFLLSTEFSAVFVKFHELFLSSSQWLFPEDYLLVNLFTESFFENVATDVMIGILISGTLLIFLSFVINTFLMIYSARKGGAHGKE